MIPDSSNIVRSQSPYINSTDDDVGGDTLAPQEKDIEGIDFSCLNETQVKVVRAVSKGHDLHDKGIRFNNGKTYCFENGSETDYRKAKIGVYYDNTTRSFCERCRTLIAKLLGRRTRDDIAHEVVNRDIYDVFQKYHTVTVTDTEHKAVAKDKAAAKHKEAAIYIANSFRKLNERRMDRAMIRQWNCNVFRSSRI